MSGFGQATIQKEVQAVGIGLHSGNLIRMALKPAAPNQGIVFSRADLGGAPVKASLENVDFEMLQMATTLRAGQVVVRTTEHLLSALYARGVDNVIVELSGEEVPIMDGSATPFLVLLEEAGIKRQAVPARILKITKPFHFQNGNKSIDAVPASDFRVTYTIDFAHPMIQKQQKTVHVQANLYDAEIAPARTFGFLKDVNHLKSKGLILGGSMDNAVVLDGDRILNGGLRLSDEFVSHKILDMIGDFAVSGLRIQGHFTAHKAGHETHALFLKALLASPSHYQIVSQEQPKDATFGVGSLTSPLVGVA
jgi:UDP-3-O-[3-hydroxymyristoyl] N-acetylglucosamine deacetylase